MPNPSTHFTVRQKRNQKTIILTLVRALNINQAELGRWAGVDRSIITKWIKGDLKITPRMALRLSRLFPEISPEQFCPDIYEDRLYPRK